MFPACHRALLLPGRGVQASSLILRASLALRSNSLRGRAGVRAKLVWRRPGWPRAGHHHRHDHHACHDRLRRLRREPRSGGYGRPLLSLPRRPFEAQALTRGLKGGSVPQRRLVGVNYDIPSVVAAYRLN